MSTVCIGLGETGCTRLDSAQLEHLPSKQHVVGSIPHLSSSFFISLRKKRCYRLLAWPCLDLGLTAPMCVIRQSLPMILVTVHESLGQNSNHYTTAKDTYSVAQQRIEGVLW